MKVLFYNSNLVFAKVPGSYHPTLNWEEGYVNASGFKVMGIAGGTWSTVDPSPKGFSVPSNNASAWIDINSVSKVESTLYKFRICPATEDSIISQRAIGRGSEVKSQSLQDIKDAYPLATHFIIQVGGSYTSEEINSDLKFYEAE